jgi:hypothetical protein
MSKRLLVCGGRYFRDQAREDAILDRIHAEIGISVVIQDGASGADRFSRIWAEKRGVPFIEECANWDAHGRGAGPKRNQKMLDVHKPDLGLAMPGGTGTADMVRRLRAAGVPTYEVPKYEDHALRRLEPHAGIASGIGWAA